MRTQESNERKKVNLSTCRILNVKIRQLVIIRKLKMNNYDLVIDISSDEEERDSNVRQSTPIKILPLNVITTLDLSESSLEATKGSTEEMMSSINNLNLSNISASTFETIGTPRKITFGTTSPGEVFTVEEQDAETSRECYFEEPETLRQLPPLQPAPVLRDITNEDSAASEPPAKLDRLDDLSVTPVEEIENAYGINLQNSREYSPLCGRGTRCTSTKLARARKQPVLITREIPHCPRPWSTGYRGALSRPAPGRDFTCCGGIPQFTRGKGHGRATQH